MLKSFQFSWLFTIIIIITLHSSLSSQKNKALFIKKKQKNQTKIISKTKKIQKLCFHNK